MLDSGVREPVEAGRHRAGKINPDAAAHQEHDSGREEQKLDGQHAAKRVPEANSSMSNSRRCR